jgi:hypothetical protein
MKNEFYVSPKPSKMMKLFWKAAGADAYILRKSTYSDQVKYFCLGGIVIATGALAGLAGGYAIYTIFEPKGSALENEIHIQTLLIASVFGIVWGLIIFNIDRFIVTSTGKGDGTEAITSQEIKGAIPRIIMGMIIALTISKPIEIRMFKSEIDQALFTKQQNIERNEKKNINSKYIGDLEEISAKILKYEKEILDAKKDYQKYNKIAVEEWEGKSGTGQSGDGPAYKMKKNEADNYKSIWETTENNNLKKVEALDKERDKLQEQMEIELSMVKLKTDKLDGLLERLKLAHQVAGFWVSLFITLLFMVIELTPIFFKMMLIKGPYDYMDENIKEIARAENGIEIEYDVYTDKKGMERHKVVNHYANKLKNEKIALIKAQEEMNLKVISNWKDKELTNIENNPEQYIIKE